MAKKTEKKTNAMRILDEAGVAYHTLYYECDGEHLDGRLVAEQVGLPWERVFKTLVARDPAGAVAVCCIPVHRRLDLKALAAAAGLKRLELPTPSSLPMLTGYLRGGVSPVGMKKAYPTFVDASALQQDEIAVSAGARGCQLLISPRDLVGFTRARVGEFVAAE